MELNYKYKSVTVSPDLLKTLWNSLYTILYSNNITSANVLTYYPDNYCTEQLFNLLVLNVPTDDNADLFVLTIRDPTIKSFTFDKSIYIKEFCDKLELRLTEEEYISLSNRFWDLGVKIFTNLYGTGSKNVNGIYIINPKEMIEAQFLKQRQIYVKDIPFFMIKGYHISLVNGEYFVSYNTDNYRSYQISYSKDLKAYKTGLVNEKGDIYYLSCTPQIYTKMIKNSTVDSLNILIPKCDQCSDCSDYKLITKNFWYAIVEKNWKF